MWLNPMNNVCQTDEILCWSFWTDPESYWRADIKPGKSTRIALNPISFYLHQLMFLTHSVYTLDINSDAQSHSQSDSNTHTEPSKKTLI